MSLCTHHVSKHKGAQKLRVGSVIPEHQFCESRHTACKLCMCRACDRATSPPGGTPLSARIYQANVLPSWKWKGFRVSSQGGHCCVQGTRGSQYNINALPYYPCSAARGVLLLKRGMISLDGHRSIPGGSCIHWFVFCCCSFVFALR